MIIDLARLERNIAEMAALAYEAQVALRPHIKTHKTLQIASMQLDAGAAEPLETLVKVNTGLGRVGVAPGAATVDLARPRCDRRRFEDAHH